MWKVQLPKQILLQRIECVFSVFFLDSSLMRKPNEIKSGLDGMKLSDAEAAVYSINLAASPKPFFCEISFEVRPDGFYRSSATFFATTNLENMLNEGIGS
jgi:hypothetical protein